MRGLGRVVAMSLALLAAAAGFLPGQKTDLLTEDEQNKLREAQDPSERIELYLAFAQARLERFDGLREKPADPKYDNGAYLDSLLGQYIALDDELKNWIEYQHQRNGDMRRGLRALLERGPQQLERLRRIQQTPDAYAADYKDSLREAIDDLSDTLDGAAKALTEQGKKFAEMKREEKATAREAKERRKEEEKRTKEEKKLRKKEHKRGVPADTDEN